MKELLLQLIDSRIPLIIITGKVTAVNDFTIDVETEEKDIPDIGISPVFENSENYLRVIPKEGSNVLIGKVGNNRAILISCTEVEKIEWKQGNLTVEASEQKVSVKKGQQTFEMKDGKFKIANQTTDLKTIITTGFDQLINSIIMTPSGPGQFSPADKLVFEQQKMNAENLLS